MIPYHEAYGSIMKGSTLNVFWTYEVGWNAQPHNLHLPECHWKLQGKKPIELKGSLGLTAGSHYISID